MRLRNAPQPKLRSRNRLIIALSSVLVGLGVLLTVWMAVEQPVGESPTTTQYPLPVTIHRSPIGSWASESLVSTREIESLIHELEIAEGGKGADPQTRLKSQRIRKQLALLKEIEDHEMRIEMRSEHAEFDPEPYRSKINMLRARLREIPGAEAGTSFP